MRCDVLAVLVAVSLAPAAGAAKPVQSAISTWASGPVILDVDPSSGMAHYELRAPVAVGSLELDIFGLSCGPEVVRAQIDQGGIFSHAFDLEHAGRLVATLSGPTAADLDLAVYGPSGRLVATSACPRSASEHIVVRLPADGRWRIEVSGSQVPAGWAEFELRVDVVEGRDLGVVSVPHGPFAPGERIPVEIRIDREPNGCAEPLALLVWGPAGDPILDEPLALREDSARR